MSVQEVNRQFNDTFMQFITELERMFPSSPAKSIKMKFQISKSMNESYAITLFFENTKNDKDVIMSKDDKYFTNNELLRDLNIDKYIMSQNNMIKSVIWQYIQTLYVLSSVYNGNIKC